MPIWSINLLQKSHKHPILYPRMHCFVKEMRTCVHIPVPKWCIVGYFSHASWDLWFNINGSVPWLLKKPWSLPYSTTPFHFQHQKVCHVEGWANWWTLCRGNVFLNAWVTISQHWLTQMHACYISVYIHKAVHVNKIYKSTMQLLICQYFASIAWLMGHVILTWFNFNTSMNKYHIPSNVSYEIM